MPSFSIIVPILGDAIDFENTLASVLRNLPTECEVVVVHDGTYDDIHDIGSEVRFVQTERRAHLIRMFNTGLRESTGEFVLLVRPGIELPFSWESEMIEAFRDPDVGSVTPVIVSTQKKSELVAAGVHYRLGLRRQAVGTGRRTSPRTLKKLSTLGPTSWAGCYRRSALEMYGTPDETLDPVFLDLDLALGLKSLGYRTAFASDCVFATPRPNMVTKEFEVPHGLSAQRAARRHPGFASGSTPTVIGWELAQSAVRPHLFQHLAQRLGASKYSDIDRLFAKRIREKKAERAVENAVATPLGLRRAA